MNTFVCDVGGTSIKVGVVNAGRILGHEEIAARPEKGLGQALDRALAVLDKLVKDAALNQKDIAGFGLAFPGIVHPQTEHILSCPAGKFDDAVNFDVSAWARARLGVGATTCNDANAALAGEANSGAARGESNVVMITLGTGLGSAAIINGVPLRGVHGQAGTLGGHFLANLHGRTCACGNMGCIETEASTWMLPELFRAFPGAAESPLAAEIDRGYEAVFRWANQGDRVAVALREASLRVWGAATVNLIHAYDPESVIFGGGILRSAEIILPAIRDYIAHHAWTPWGKVQVKPAQLGEQAGLVGMAHLVERRLETIS